MRRSRARRLAILAVAGVACLSFTNGESTAVALTTVKPPAAIRFERDEGLLDNGSSSADSTVVHFSDSIGEDLFVCWNCSEGRPEGYSLWMIDGDASKLVITFDVPVGRLSLRFGNDDAISIQPGDVAVLRAMRRGVAIRTSVVPLNRNDLIDQSILLKNTKFKRVEFYFARGAAPINVGEMVDDIRYSPFCGIQGTEGRDRLSGDSEVNAICGLGSRDRIFARGANDFVDAGAGNDRVRGGSGGDTLIGGVGDDYLISADGVGGNDTVFGGPGSDTCVIDRFDKASGCEHKIVV